MTTDSRPMDRAALAEALRQSPIFAELDGPARAELAGASQLIRCARRTVLLATGAPHRALFHVIAGQIDYCGTTSEGEEITLATFGPGRSSSWLAAYGEGRARRDLIAVPRSVVLAIPYNALRAVLAAHPALYPHVLAYEARRFQALLDWSQQSLIADRRRRLALLLVLIAEISGDAAPQPTVRLTGERLARTAQCSRQTLSVALGALERAGLIARRYGGVQLLDPAGLRALAGGGL